MLNEELFKEYGEESKKFFDMLCERLSSDVLSYCYAVKETKVDSGELHAPNFIGVCSEDSSVVQNVRSVCLDITMELADEYDEREPAVFGISYSAERAKKKGIRVWVN